MRVLCVMVLYNPDVEVLKTKLEVLQENVDGILLWDNTPNANLNNINGIPIMRCGFNIGLSRAYNMAWQIAVKDKFEYLMTMDQDSTWNNLPLYMEKIMKYESNREESGMCCYFANTKHEKNYEYKLINLKYGGG